MTTRIAAVLLCGCSFVAFAALLAGRESSPRPPRKPVPVATKKTTRPPQPPRAQVGARAIPPFPSHLSAPVDHGTQPQRLDAPRGKSTAPSSQALARNPPRTYAPRPRSRYELKVPHPLRSAQPRDVRTAREIECHRRSSSCSLSSFRPTTRLPLEGFRCGMTAASQKEASRTADLRAGSSETGYRSDTRFPLLD